MKFVRYMPVLDGYGDENVSKEIISRPEVEIGKDQH